MKSRILNSIFQVCGLVAGALSVIFSFVILSFDAGSYHRDSAYGGDAYTGIQNAAAATARNITDLAKIAKFGFFALLFIGGVLAICYFGKSLVLKRGADERPIITERTETRQNTVTDQENEPAQEQEAVQADNVLPEL